MKEGEGGRNESKEGGRTWRKADMIRGQCCGIQSIHDLVRTGKRLFKNIHSTTWESNS